MVTKEDFLDVYSDGGDWEDFEPLIDALLSSIKNQTGGDRDVSSQFYIGSVDDENLPVMECMCGAEFKGWSDFVLSIYRDTPTECPKCHRKFYFRNSIRIYQVEEE